MAGPTLTHRVCLVCAQGTSAPSSNTTNQFRVVQYSYDEVQDASADYSLAQCLQNAPTDASQCFCAHQVNVFNDHDLPNHTQFRDVVYLDRHVQPRYAVAHLSRLPLRPQLPPRER
jgi:hypothetical protein